MRKPTRIDLTAIEGEPSVRAEIRFELDTDELAARRLRGQVILERELRTDPPARRSGPDGESRNGKPRSQPSPGRPVYRSIFAVDIEGSTKRTNTAKSGLRHTMYRLLETALRVAGVSEQDCDELVDRGDGVLVLIRANDAVPKALLLDTVLPTLIELLTEHNRGHPDLPLRLRAVVHAGDVHFDGMGWFGEALDQAFRLLDAAGLKRKLLQSTEPLVLVVSDEIYRSIVLQGYAGIDRQDFTSTVWVRVGEQRHRGWVRVPRQPVAEVRLPELPAATEPATGTA